MNKVVVLGGGSWGTALGVHLAGLGNPVSIYDVGEQQINEINIHRSNSRYLPGITIPQNITGFTDLDVAMEGARFVIVAVPSSHVRNLAQAVLPFINTNMIFINCSKGLESKSHLRLSEVLINTFGVGYKSNITVLSGPTHAEEVSRELPSAAVIAGIDENNITTVQQLFNSPSFRIYTHNDIIGVELGGAVKNIIAIAAGISDGMGYGDNSKAALVTRGLQEMIRLGTSLGAQLQTFSGLSGLGDLFVTCASKYSRNWRFGNKIGGGMDMASAIKEVDQVVEGIPTTDAIYSLSLECGVDMPLTKKVYEVLFKGLDPKEAVNKLMGRSLKNEMEDL